MVLGDAVEHIGEPCLRVDAVHVGGLDEGIGCMDALRKNLRHRRAVFHRLSLMYRNSSNKARSQESGASAQRLRDTYEPRYNLPRDCQRD